MAHMSDATKKLLDSLRSRGYETENELIRGKEMVKLCCDGENYIFVYLRLDTELGWYAQTISEPCSIGNAPM